MKDIGLAATSKRYCSFFTNSNCLWWDRYDARYSLVRTNKKKKKNSTPNKKSINMSTMSGWLNEAKQNGSPVWLLAKPNCPLAPVSSLTHRHHGGIDCSYKTHKKKVNKQNVELLLNMLNSLLNSEGISWTFCFRSSALLNSCPKSVSCTCDRTKAHTDILAPWLPFLEQQGNVGRGGGGGIGGGAGGREKEEATGEQTSHWTWLSSSTHSASNQLWVSQSYWL